MVLALVKLWGGQSGHLGHRRPTRPL